MRGRGHVRLAVPCRSHGGSSLSAGIGALARGLGLTALLSVLALTALGAAAPRGGSSSLSTAADRVPPARTALPLSVSSNRRYLVDARGKPFLIVGDSPQSIIVNVSLDEAARYFANRRAAGFNAAWVNLLSNGYAAGRSGGPTTDGIAPFKGGDDLARPNESYFRRADAVIRLAARYGITVFLNPIETGGWLTVLQSNGVAKSHAYGRWLGNRYKSFGNLVWFNGSDFQSWRDPAADAVVLAVAHGIKATDPNHIQTLQLNYDASGSRDDARWSSIINLDAAYTYFPTYAQVLKEYSRRRSMPVFMVEANYEFEHDYTGPQTLRRQEYWTMLSGATGQLYGSKYIWRFLPEWKAYLHTRSVVQLGYMKKLFAPRPWFKLIPDQRHVLVTDGYGTFSTTGSVNDNDYVTAATTRDRKLGIAYLPVLRAITVNLGALAGPVRAQWYDPTSGTFSTARGSPFENSGTAEFLPPGPNADGDEDWVLVLSSR
jgi:hypothetical protein